MKSTLRLTLITLFVTLLCACASAESLNVMVYDRGDMPEAYGTPTNNAWTQYLQQQCLSELGIEVTYTAVSRANDVEEIKALMAGADPPDILFTYDYDLWARFCGDGLLADLAEPLARYGDNLVKNQASVLRYARYNGKQYGVCNQRASIEVTSGFIRKDWLDRIGVQPTFAEDGTCLVTPDELFDILAAFQKHGLCREDGATFLSYGSTNWPVLLLLEAYYEPEKISQEDLYALPDFLYAGAKEGYRFLNRLFNAGLLNADFAFIGDNDKSPYARDIIDGKAGFWINDSWFGFTDKVLESLYANDPEARVVALDIVGANGKRAYKYAYYDYGMQIFVPAASEHVDAAVRYLNFLSDPKNDFILRYGFEGEHYTLQDGLPVAIDRDYNRETRIAVSDLALMYNGCTYLAQWEDMLLGIHNLPDALRAVRRQSHNVATSHYFQLPVPEGYVTVSNSKQSLLDAKRRQLYFECVMCAPERFDETWNACVADYLNNGGQTLIDAKRALYRRDGGSED